MFRVRLRMCLLRSKGDSSQIRLCLVFYLGSFFMWNVFVRTKLYKRYFIFYILFGLLSFKCSI